MANSKCEYVKWFEVWDEVMLPNFILVRINGRHFKFSTGSLPLSLSLNEYLSVDVFFTFDVRRSARVREAERDLSLMNSCAVSLMEDCPDISFSYGFSDEFSFVFQRTYRGYDRRASKLLSIIVSLFASLYVTRWNDYFPEAELQFAPSFHGRVTCCATIDYLQEYLAWRQLECHIRNQYDTCFWMLVKQGKTKQGADEDLKDT